VRLTVRDDGSGFLPEALPVPTATGGHGIAGMRERTERIGATFTLGSEPGRGTRLELVVSRSRRRRA